MTTFLLAHPTDLPAYILPLGAFIAHLEFKWNITRLELWTESRLIYSMQWYMQVTEEMCGRFSLSPSIAFDASLIDAATFAVWYRTLIPSEYDLMLYGLGYDIDIWVTSNTTVEEIITTFEGNF